MGSNDDDELAELKAFRLAQAEGRLPRHVAIIMDGNGRWAEQRRLPRFAGHRSGADSLKAIVEASGEYGLEALTVFAFSSENWQRPKEEVSMLMSLFMTTLEQQVKRLDANNVRLRVIGDRSAFSKKLQEKIAESEAKTAHNNGLQLNIAANYGGRWDITQAVQTIAQQIAAGKQDANAVSEETLEARLAFSEFPEPDLFIRTGGEQRMSNFLLWQLAYTELYFTDVLWPDFDVPQYRQAMLDFSNRQRRFGRTGRQVTDAG